MVKREELQELQELVFQASEALLRKGAEDEGFRLLGRALGLLDALLIRLESAEEVR